MKIRIRKKARLLSLVGLLALPVAPPSSAAQGDAPNAERALLGKTDAPFGVSEENTPRIHDGTRALLGRDTEDTAPAVQSGRAIRTTANRVSGVESERALLGRSTWREAGRPGQSGATD